MLILSPEVGVSSIISTLPWFWTTHNTTIQPRVAASSFPPPPPCPTESVVCPQTVLACPSTYTITQDDIDRAGLKNTATVYCTSPPDNVTDTDEVTVVLLGYANVSVGKSLLCFGIVGPSKASRTNARMSTSWKSSFVGEDVFGRAEHKYYTCSLLVIQKGSCTSSL